jgi:hypothetical protein
MRELRQCQLIKSHIIIPNTPTPRVSVGNILLPPPLNRTLIIRIKAHPPRRLLTYALANSFIPARASSRAVFEEDVEQFVGDGEVGFLPELLQGGEFEEHF